MMFLELLARVTRVSLQRKTQTVRTGLVVMMQAVGVEDTARIGVWWNRKTGRVTWDGNVSRGFVSRVVDVPFIPVINASLSCASMAEFRMRRVKLPIEVIAMVLSELTHA